MAQLATGSATGTLTNIRGRAILSARGHHIIVDSPPTLDGPNEELNPIDLLLSSLGSCGVFICEKVAYEDNIPLQSVKLNVAADFDPRGICGEPVSSKIQQIRIKITMQGPTQEQAGTIVAGFTSRCPIYATLIEAAPIDIQVDLMPA